MAFEDFFNLAALGMQRLGIGTQSPAQPMPVTARMRQQQPLIDPRPGSPFGNVYEKGAGYNPSAPVQSSPASPIIGQAMARMASTGGQFRSYGGGLSRIGPKAVDAGYTARLKAENGQVWGNV